MASVRQGATAGTRDERNGGMSVQDFVARANEHITERRAAHEGAGLLLPRRQASTGPGEWATLLDGAAKVPLDASRAAAPLRRTNFRSARRAAAENRA